MRTITYWGEGWLRLHKALRHFPQHKEKLSRSRTREDAVTSLATTLGIPLEGYQTAESLDTLCFTMAAELEVMAQRKRTLGVN